jgi:hypothetical protein
MDCRVKPGNDDAEKREATSGSGIAGFTIGPGFRFGHPGYVRLPSSPPGLTRRSMLMRGKQSLTANFRSGVAAWIAGSSPAMTMQRGA